MYIYIYIYINIYLLNILKKCIIPSSGFLLLYIVYFKIYMDIKLFSLTFSIDCSVAAKPRPSTENANIEMFLLPPTQYVFTASASNSIMNLEMCSYS